MGEGVCGGSHLSKMPQRSKELRQWQMDLETKTKTKPKPPDQVVKQKRSYHLPCSIPRWLQSVCRDKPQELQATVSPLDSVSLHGG